MKTSIFFSLLFLIALPAAFGQIDFSANDGVPEYNSGFRWGTNLGGHIGEWEDLDLATLAAGSEAENVPGAGCNSLRLALPNHFLERRGYNIRVNTFKQYTAKLNMSELTVFLEGPSDDNLDKKVYGKAKSPSKMFKNLYEPIWDNGKKGTPVNDDNAFALYVYQTAMHYGPMVRFWEIWNEPDYTTTDRGWQGPEVVDSWWNRDPEPSELNNLHAPIQHYIRALRIAYEVIKFVDPEDFICIGGIGHDSFLDAVLRNTDNPNGGKVTGAYPLTGGAYFDCLSYHNYPMYGTREYKNGQWVPMRHSDKAVEVFLNSKRSKEKVLEEYGYGTKYPKKRVIVTETNVARKSFEATQIGSEAAQYNYLAKIIIKGQSEDIDQIHTYNLRDGKEAKRAYDVMGFYPWLEDIKPFRQKEHKSAVASRNAMEMLEGYKFASYRTRGLNLPDEVDGAAFVKDGKYIYALWAKTKTDNSENSSAKYTFPASWEIAGFSQYGWDYTLTGKSQKISGNTAQLSGSPSFFIMDSETVVGTGKVNPEETFQVYPNPSNGAFALDFGRIINKGGTVQIFDMQGKAIYAAQAVIGLSTHAVQLNLPAGLYIVKAFVDLKPYSAKIVVK